MPTCATCGRPVDQVPARRACPSCTWRAAVRASKTAVTADTSRKHDVASLDLVAEGGDLPIDLSIDPVELTSRLCGLAAAAGESLTEEQALRVYAALLRGNPRPYQTHLNRLASGFINRLEDAWQS